MRVLAFDFGSKRTGVAYADADGELQWAKLWSLTSKREESWGVRWLRLRNLLKKLGTEEFLGRVDLVAFEEVKGHRGTYAAHAYGASKGVVLAWCEENDLQYQGVTVADIKRTAVGKGSGSGTGKEEVLAAAKARWPRIDFATDDVADAAFCAVTASGQWQ